MAGVYYLLQDSTGFDRMMHGKSPKKQEKQRSLEDFIVSMQRVFLILTTVLTYRCLLSMRRCNRTWEKMTCRKFFVTSRTPNIRFLNLLTWFINFSSKGYFGRRSGLPYFCVLFILSTICVVVFIKYHSRFNFVIDFNLYIFEKSNHCFRDSDW